MDDETIVALGAYAILLGGIVSGNSVGLAEAAKLSALTLGHVRSPDTIGLIGAGVAYPGRTSLSENAIIGVIKKRRSEATEHNLDALATVLSKLLDRFERA